jgi:hypothetical protein
MTRVHDGVFVDALDHTVACFVFRFSRFSRVPPTLSNMLVISRLGQALLVPVVPGTFTYGTREIMFAILRDIDNLRVAHSAQYVLPGAHPPVHVGSGIRGGGKRETRENDQFPHAQLAGRSLRIRNQNCHCDPLPISRLNSSQEPNN